MCLSPSTIGYKPGDGLGNQSVACRKCRICRDNRVNDLVGRCIAEQCTSTKAFSVTLTYAGDVPEAAILRYEDVQLFLKRVRKAGFKVRYICAGEYGEKKGRAHWHIILFFTGRVPDIEMERRVNWDFWPHGYVYFQNPDYRGFKYVMKYVLKQEGQIAVKALSMSKKPPLGYDYFIDRADEIARQGLPVHSPEYSFSDVLDKEGRPRKYWLQGRMREIFLERYCATWRELYGSEPPQTEWLVERYIDPIAKAELENDATLLQEQFERRKAAKERLRELQRADYKKRKVREIGWLLLQYSNTMITAFSDGTAEFDTGDGIWYLTFASVSVVRNVAEQLLRSGLPQSEMQAVLAWIQQMRGRTEPTQLSP